jgi:hypothetical protein
MSLQKNVQTITLIYYMISLDPVGCYYVNTVINLGPIEELFYNN